MGRISICKKFKFDAAHHLPEYDGPCQRVHGHTFHLEVMVTGEIQDQGHKSGMIMDFGDLKRLVNRVIIDRYDHQDLNTIFINPTAENMIGFMAIELLHEITVCNLPIFLVRLRLYETEDSYVEWRTI